MILRAVHRFVLGLALVAAPAVAMAGNWDSMLFLDRTATNTVSGRLCVGTGGATIACPAFAPSVTALGDVTLAGGLLAPQAAITGNLTVGGNLYVSGTQSFDGVTFANGGISASSIDVGSVTSPIVSATVVNGQYVSGTSGYFAGLAVDTGTITSLGVGNMAMSGNLTGPLLVSTSSGGVVSSTYVNAQVVSGTTGYFSGDVNVAGNLNVSGSQSIDGVVFANGGISATRLDVGDISSTYIYGQYVSGTSGYFAGLVVDTGTITSLGVGNMAVSGNVTGAVLTSSSVGGVISGTNVNALNVSGTNLHAATGVVTGDFTVGGNLYVSGSQSIDGVVFANGGISASSISVGDVSSTYIYGRYVSGTSGYFAGLAVDTGTVTSLGVSNMAVSGNITGPVLVSGSEGSTVSTTYMNAYGISGTTLQATTGLFRGDVTILGNLNVSGTQTFDGVTFARGGISASSIDVGTVTTDLISSTYVYGQYVSGSAIYAGALTSGPASLASIGTGAIAMTGNLTGAPLISTSEGGVISGTNVNALNVSGTNLHAVTGVVTGDFTVGGNLYVSGSQSIDGVVFANGGISASSISVGDVSSTYLYGRYVSGTSGYFAGLAVDTATITSLGVGNMAVSGNMTGAVLVSGSTGGVISGTYVHAQIVSAAEVYSSGRLYVDSAAAILSDTVVSGTLKVSGDGTEGCTVADEGKIRVNPGTHTLQICSVR